MGLPILYISFIPRRMDILKGLGSGLTLNKLKCYIEMCLNNLRIVYGRERIRSKISPLRLST